MVAEHRRRCRHRRLSVVGRTFCVSVFKRDCGGGFSVLVCVCKSVVAEAHSLTADSVKTLQCVYVNEFRRSAALMAGQLAPYCGAILVCACIFVYVWV